MYTQTELQLDNSFPIFCDVDSSKMWTSSHRKLQLDSSSLYLVMRIVLKYGAVYCIVFIYIVIHLNRILKKS